LEDWPYTASASKTVKIYSTPLSILEKSLYAIITISFTLYFIKEEQYLRRIEDGVAGKIVWWAQGNENHALLGQAQSTDLTKPFCSTSSQFDYVYDRSGNPSSNYTDNVCLPFCGHEVLSSETSCSANNNCSNEVAAKLSCRDYATLYFTDGGELFVPTHLQLFSGRLGSGVDANYFLTGTEAVKLFFFVTYKVAEPHTFFSMEKSAISGSSSTNLLTVIQVNGERQDVYTPEMVQDADMSLTLSKALSIAGVSLDGTVPLAGKNKLAGGYHPEGPLARITGATLTLSMHVTDRHSEYWNGRRWRGPVCLVSIDLDNEFMWTFNTQFHRQDNVLWRYHGLRIKYVVTGSFGLWDLRSLVLNLSAAIVLLGIPTAVITRLGNTSNFYKRFIAEPIDWNARTAGMAMRLVADSMIFESLSDADGKLDEKIVRKRLADVLRNSPIVKGSLRSVDSEAFKSMVHDMYEHAKELGDMDFSPDQTFKKGLACWPKKAEGSLEVSDFSVACSRVSNFSIRALLMMYMEPRKRSYIDRLTLWWDTNYAPFLSGRQVSPGPSVIVGNPATQDEEEKEEESHEAGLSALETSCTQVTLDEAAGIRNCLLKSFSTTSQSELAGQGVGTAAPSKEFAEEDESGPGRDGSPRANAANASRAAVPETHGQSSSSTSLPTGGTLG